MNLPIGVVINAVAVVAGGLIGSTLGDKLPNRIHKTVFPCLGLCTIVLGISLVTDGHFLIMAGSLIFGSIIGSLLYLDIRIEQLGEFFQRKFNSNNSKFTEGFVSASLLFCVGSAAILGPIQEYADGDRSLILTKTMLDFFTSIILSSTLGRGVILSALSVAVYQGAIFALTPILMPFLSTFAMAQLLGVGGMILIGMGFVIMDIKKVPLANMMPAMVLAVIIANLIQ